MTKLLVSLLEETAFAKSGAVIKLHGLGYTTVEEVVATAAVARKELNEFVGFDILAELENTAIAREGNKRLLSMAAIPPPEPKLGVLLARIPPECMVTISNKFRSVSKAAELPRSVSLVRNLPPIRDQRHRGTCVAFATLSALETPADDFSEQFVYALCKQRDGVPDVEGTWLGTAYPILRDVGVCFEKTWPYVTEPIAGNEGQNPPPAAAMHEASSHRRSFISLTPTDVQELKAALAAGFVISFSIPAYASWARNREVFRSGRIVMPLRGEQTPFGHAMALVGYQDEAFEPGGGRFLLRNSWGKKWGEKCPFGAGYGTIPYQFIANDCREAYCFS